MIDKEKLEKIAEICKERTYTADEYLRYGLFPIAAIIGLRKQIREVLESE